MVVHAFSPHSWEVEVGGSLGVRDQPGLHNKLQANEDCIVRFYLRKKKKKFYPFGFDFGLFVCGSHTHTYRFPQRPKDVFRFLGDKGYCEPPAKGAGS